MLIVSGATTGRCKWPKGGGRASIKIPLGFPLLFSSRCVCWPSHLLKEKGHGHLLRTYSNDCGGIKGSPFYLTEKLRLKGYNAIPRDTEQLNKSFLQNLPKPRLPFYDKSFEMGLKVMPLSATQGGPFIFSSQPAGL